MLKSEQMLPCEDPTQIGMSKAIGFGVLGSYLSQRFR